MVNRSIIFVFGISFSILTGIVFSAQILAFVEVFQPLTALISSVIAACLFAVLFFRRDSGWRSIFVRGDDSGVMPTLRFTALIAVIVMFGAVFLLRLALYPTADTGLVVPLDALGYHYVKAIELARSGSFWDLTVPYGQFAIGYESLAAFSLSLTGGWRLFGVFNALIVLLLLLTVYLLLRRYSPLPDFIALAAAVAVFFIPPLYSFVLLVGKNDALLTLSVLLGLLFAPVGLSQDADEKSHPMALAMATMLGVATKPTAAYVLGVVWLFVLWDYWRQWRRSDVRLRRVIVDWLLIIVILIPAALWILRNWIVMGALFSPEISTFFIGSIAYNLTNPDLYLSGTESLLLGMYYFVTALMCVSLLSKSRRLALLVAVTAVAFAITPLSAFHTPERVVLHVEWRYVMHGLLLLLVLLIALTSRTLKGYGQALRMMPQLQHIAALCLAFAVGSFLLMFNVPSRLSIPESEQALFRDPYYVADAEYDNVYDFVRREIADRVVFYEFAERFFFYTPDDENIYTNGAVHPLGAANTVTHPTPEVVVFGNPGLLDASEWAFVTDDPDWQRVYEDARSLVFVRR